MAMIVKTAYAPWWPIQLVSWLLSEARMRLWTPLMPSPQ